MNETSPLDARSSADLAGMLASIACAIHCAAMPLVIGYLPMLGLSWLADESFHKVMAGVCFVLAISAFLPGWRRHGSWAPAVVGATGVALLAGAAFGLEGECCPSCTTAGEAPIAELACTDEQCPLCIASEPDETPAAELPAAPAPAIVEPAIGEPSEVNLVSWATPFITPFGGILLVAGHLVNHRKSCRCAGDRCCVDTASGPEDEQLV